MQHVAKEFDRKRKEKGASSKGHQDGADLAALAPSLPRCGALETIYLDGNRIVEAAALAEVLPECPALKYVYLGGNPLGEESKRALRDAADRAGVKLELR